MKVMHPLNPPNSELFIGHYVYIAAEDIHQNNLRFLNYYQLT